MSVFFILILTGQEMIVALIYGIFSGGRIIYSQKIDQSQKINNWLKL
jgi:hypothetical protein